MTSLIIVNIILIHIFLSFASKIIKIYLPILANNSIIETLNIYYNKIVTSSVILAFVSYYGILLASNIK
jgi:TRAP-type uncharacterized transport system fused permease subunit